jgi:hypothetical protein
MANREKEKKISPNITAILMGLHATIVYNKPLSIGLLIIKKGTKACRPIAAIT